MVAETMQDEEGLRTEVERALEAAGRPLNRRRLHKAIRGVEGFEGLELKTLRQTLVKGVELGRWLEPRKSVYVSVGYTAKSSSEPAPVHAEPEPRTNSLLVEVFLVFIIKLPSFNPIL